MTESERMQAFVAQPIRFEPFCFHGETLPSCDFDQPQAVRELIGPYTIKVRYYDGQGRPTSAAHEPGRYGAVIEIQHERRTSTRFATLCRMGGTATSDDVLNNPDALVAAGIDAEVIEAHRSELGPPPPDKFYPPPPGDAHAAVLAAGLYGLTHCKHAGKPLPTDTFAQIDRQWWVDFRRKFYRCEQKWGRTPFSATATTPKMGVSPHFCCPRPIDGEPAPTIREGTLAEAGMKPDALATIDRACEAWVAAIGIGFALCVVRHGVLVLNKAYGLQTGSEKPEQPFTPETVSPLASTTKFLSAILMAEFADQGLIAIDEPVAPLVPALRGVTPPKILPTIRDLYLHTAGFTGHWGDLHHDLEEVIADLYPTLEVRAVHRYQGVGHALAGKIMELISGESIPRLYRRHLFGPLGCEHIRSDRTSYGSWGTTMDLARIGQMMLNGGAYGPWRFTSPEVIRQMMPIPGNDRFEPDLSVRWGIGSKLFDSDGLSEQSYGHSGAGGCFLKIDPAYDLVITHTRFDEGHDFNKHRASMIAAILASIA